MPGRVEGMGMRIQEKTPRSCTGARGMNVTLLRLIDFQDFNIIRAARGFHFHSITDLMVKDRFTNG